MSTSEAHPFPTKPLASVSFPPTPLVRAAYSYVHEHTSPAVANHTIRAAIFALVLLKKLSSFPNTNTTDVDPETLVLSTILHDLGLSKSPGLVSPDKRFEIDGADAARSFIRSHLQNNSKDGGDVPKWDETRLQSVWYSIALHTTPSIAIHSSLLVVLTGMGTLADFMGPNLKIPSNNFPAGEGKLITEEEFTEVLRAYPRLGFKEELKDIMCGLCREKSAATFDNFAADFGKAFVEGYAERCEQANIVTMLNRSLDATVEFE